MNDKRCTKEQFDDSIAIISQSELKVADPLGIFEHPLQLASIIFIGGFDPDFEDGHHSLNVMLGLDTEEYELGYCMMEGDCLFLRKEMGFFWISDVKNRLTAGVAV